MCIESHHPVVVVDPFPELPPIDGINRARGTAFYVIKNTRHDRHFSIWLALVRGLSTIAHDAIPVGHALRVSYYPDGSRVFGAYREGPLDGVWTMNDANGATVERECWKDGRWMEEAGFCAE